MEAWGSEKSFKDCDSAQEAYHSLKSIAVMESERVQNLVVSGTATAAYIGSPVFKAF